MASVPRAQLSRILGLALRSRTTGIRPATFAWASRWRYLATAAYPACNNGHRVHDSRLHSLLLTASRLAIPTRSVASGGLTAQELEDRVLNVLKLFDKVNPEKVTLEAHFMKDLGMDSLDAVEVVMAFEDEFAVEISDEEAEKIFTCKDAVELLKSKLDIH